MSSAPRLPCMSTYSGTIIAIGDPGANDGRGAVYPYFVYSGVWPSNAITADVSFHGLGVDVSFVTIGDEVYLKIATSRGPIFYPAQHFVGIG